MDKEDKQIIERATKEEWRIGDRTRLKRLLEKNLKLYRENVELERKLEQTEKDLADYQFNYPTIKELTEGTCFAHLKSLEKENTELKDLLKNIIRVTWGEGWNYSLDWKVKAEQFLNSVVEK
jgi:hypothetical protein